MNKFNTLYKKIVNKKTHVKEIKSVINFIIELDNVKISIEDATKIMMKTNSFNNDRNYKNMMREIYENGHLNIDNAY